MRYKPPRPSSTLPRVAAQSRRVGFYEELAKYALIVAALFRSHVPPMSPQNKPTDKRYIETLM